MFGKIRAKEQFYSYSKLNALGLLQNMLKPTHVQTDFAHVDWTYCACSTRQASLGHGCSVRQSFKHWTHSNISDVIHDTSVLFEILASVASGRQLITCADWPENHVTHRLLKLKNWAKNTKIFSFLFLVDRYRKWK